MDFEQAIQELQTLYNTSNRVPGFRKKVMVDGERFAELITAIRGSLPANVQEAEEILKQKDSILNQAYLEAQRVKTTVEEQVTEQIEAAQQEHVSKVDESEIVRAAEIKGQEIRDEAMVEAQEIIQDAQRRALRTHNESESTAISRREGADQYAREVLFSMEEQLSEILGQIRRGIDTLRTEPENSVPDIQIPVS
ncbi:MAG: hypothetical protein IIC24_00400 [Chloroflexi bacterium]|nr:hypothetical protein [Chloroflexota bacterium]